VNINADIAARLLSSRAFRATGVDLTCRCLYPGGEHSQNGSLWKVGKNWRFGGPKREGDVFRNVREGDFLLLRSPIHNDGDREVSLNFISAAADPEAHQWLLQREPDLQSDSMTAVVTGSDVRVLVRGRYYQRAGSPVSAAGSHPDGRGSSQCRDRG
jgi:hypothetical protein